MKPIPISSRNPPIAQFSSPTSAFSSFGASSSLFELSIGFGGWLLFWSEYHRILDAELIKGSVLGAAGLDRMARALHAPQILNLGDMAELRVAK